MKQCLVLLFSIFLFIGCDRAVFETGGDSASLASGLEVVSEEEQQQFDTQQDSDTENQTTDCGADCSEGDSDKETEHEQHSDKDCENHDCDHKHCRDGKKHKETITPDELFSNEETLKEQGCHENNSEKKSYICHWPSADENKAHTLCVSKSSLNHAVQKRRQDHYYVGPCLKDQITADDLNSLNP